MLNLNKVVSSAAALAIGSLFVLTTGCNSSGDASNGISSNKSAHARVPAAPADDTAASASGNVIWGGITHEDGTPMSKDELNSDIAELPTLGVNYDELQSAVTADSASGIVTLYDANGNVIATIPAAGYGTIRSVTTTASSMDEKGNCTNGNLVFDLNDTQQAVPAATQDKGQYQSQAQDKGDKTPAVAPVYAGFDVILNLACVQPAVQPAQQQPAQQQPAQQQPAQQSKEQPAQAAPQQQSKGQPTQAAPAVVPPQAVTKK